MPKEREDVKATVQQDTTSDVPQQKRKWRAIDWIAGSTFVAEVVWGAFWLVTQVFHWCSWTPPVDAEHFAQFYCSVGLGILSAGYLRLILWPTVFSPIVFKIFIFFNIFKQGKESKQDNDPRWFHARILSSGIVGGAYAFLLPVVMSLPEGNVNSGGAAALRQAILLATGGLIALIALGETRRKNDNDKLKNDQDKEKNDREHERWVKAERRERYAKAVEQLGDEKAPVRMGGVYTLVGLVDDWLEEKSLSDDERLKEGQAIINNLCAYIRSPFTLASYYDELSQASPTPEGIYKDKEEFYADKAVLESEADVRLGIIKEIHDHIQTSRENDWGSWSNFEYNFSGSVFFYPVELTKSYYKKPVNFSGSHYYKKVNFSGSTYEKDATFSTSNFRSTYQGGVDFTGSTYQGGVDFTGSTYQGGAHFSRSIYKDKAYFTGSAYRSWADFSRSTYQGGAHFSHSAYRSWVDFTGSAYRSWVDFTGSTYTGEAHFSRSIYKDKAHFSDSTYQGGAHFSDSTYQGGAHFSGSIFYQETYFGAGLYNSFSRFTDCAPQFYDETYRKNTLFGSPTNDFTAENGRGYPIYRNLEGLPLGCKFLTSEQKEYLEGKIQEIEKINDEIFEVKDPEEKVELSKNLHSLNKEIHEWRKKNTTVKVEDVATEDTES